MCQENADDPSRCFLVCCQKYLLLKRIKQSLLVLSPQCSWLILWTRFYIYCMFAVLVNHVKTILTTYFLLIQRMLLRNIRHVACITPKMCFIL